MMNVFDWFLCCEMIEGRIWVGFIVEAEQSPFANLIVSICPNILYVCENGWEKKMGGRKKEWG